MECKKCGKELSKRQKIYCSNTCKLTDPDNIKLRTSKKEKQDSSKLIKCKYTGKTFKDISNYSGVLTRHLQKLEKDISDIFSHFDIIINPDYNKPKYKCKYCAWESKDVKNVSGWVSLHIKNSHSIEIVEHIKKYPEEKELFSYNMKNKVREDYFNETGGSYVICKICGEKHKKISSSHLKKHGLTPIQYKLKYNTGTMSELSKDKAREIYFEKFDTINTYKRTSSNEEEIAEYIRSFDLEVIQSDRTTLKPLELDIFIPSLNIAIEYNGLAWHSEFFGKKDRYYHLNKTNACEQKGIKLIHIFDDEWINKKNIVKRKLENLLKKRKNSIYARKCDIRIVQNYDKNIFLNRNHIQGEDRSQYHLGLYYKDELVAVMTFTKPRIFMGKRESYNEYELSRYASSIPIVGGASKLLNHFIKTYNPYKIITFADRRWTTILNDSMYEKIGFKKIGINKPNYWYILNGRVRRHRYSYNKHTIVKKMGGDPNLTEIQNMINMGYDRIWDCGSIKYELIINKE